MGLYLGNLVLTRARKEKSCSNPQCPDDVIKMEELYANLATKSGKRFFRKSLHMYCLSDFAFIKGNSWVENLKPRVGINRYTRLDNPVEVVKLPDEVRVRRLSLIKYLNHRDIKSLCTAYKGGKQSRVYLVMTHMAQRMAELELIDDEWGIKSPWWVLHLHDFPELRGLVMAHDARWWGEVSRLLFYPDRVDRGEVLAMFLRGENSPEPYWQAVSEYDKIPVEVSGDERVQVPEVPHD
jgi:hypothetical protein